MPSFHEPVEVLTERLVATHPGNVRIVLTGANQGGYITIENNQGENRIRLNGANATIELGGNRAGGAITLKDADGQDTIGLTGQDANLWLGREGVDGDMTLRNKAGRDTVSLQGSGEGEAGTITLKNADGQDTIWLVGQRANLWLGREGVEGDMTLRNKAGLDTLSFQGEGGNVRIGGTVGIGTMEPAQDALLHVDGANNDEWGMILSSPKGSAKGLKISTAWYGHDNIPLLQVGALDGAKEVTRFVINANGDAFFCRADGSRSIHLDANGGDIKLLAADCAEDFDVDESDALEPGTVMVIGNGEKLHQCSKAYDKRVAGVLSGAGDYRPGLILGKRASQSKRLPLALTGTVYCRVDAQYAAIEVGDLLTTSPTPGHAMKAASPFEAFGAVIGKALRALKTGNGLIPIIVALQ